jgi:aminopeptidase N
MIIFINFRISTIQKLSGSSLNNDQKVIAVIENIAKNDKNKKVKAAAINFLVKTNDNKYLPIFEKAINDSSYSVAGAAFKGLNALNPDGAYALAKKYSSDTKGAFGDEVMKTILSKGVEADFDFISKTYADAPLSQEKISLTDKFAAYLSMLNDINKVKKGIDYIIEFRNKIPEQFRSFVDPGFKKSLEKISKAKGADIESYINSAFK